MGLISKVYTPGNIFQAPVNVYVGITAPASSAAPAADAQCLALDAAGAPSSGAGFHVGHIDGPTEISITEKVNEIMDDQHDVPVDVAFVSIDADISFTMKETNLGRLQSMLTGGALSAYSAITGQQALQLGGQQSTAIGPTSLLLVAPRRDNAAKFIYALFYRAYLASGIQLTFQRSKESIIKVKFNALMDTTRVAGDELLQIVRQK